MHRSLLVAAMATMMACSKKHNTPTPGFNNVTVSVGSNNVAAYTISHQQPYTVLFECGLGDDHNVWNSKGLPTAISTKADVILYDRSGYGNSPKGPDPRDIPALSANLGVVIDSLAKDHKVVLVAHSLGAMIVRYYAVLHPEKVAGILFIDPSQESYNNPTQAQEDMIYNTFKSSYGASFGGTMEARQLIEDAVWMQKTGPLPNVPVIVLTSMKTDADHDAADRQRWYAAHELLKNGVTDFTHITTTQAGHYIFVDQPSLVADNLNLLLSKLR